LKKIYDILSEDALNYPVQGCRCFRGTYFQAI